MPVDEESKLQKYQMYEQHINYCSHISRRNLIVSLVSEYDLLIDALIRMGFAIHPQILDSSERQFTFSELSKFETIEDARNSLIDKEVETVMRDSHSKQFEYIAKMFASKDLDKIPGWDGVVEITERRNTFVHCDGRVSRQYLSVCKQNKVKLPEDCTLNSELDVDSDYFSRSYKNILKVGVILTHKLWRQFKKDEIEIADNHFINLCVRIIIEEDYDFALELLNFAEASLFYKGKTKNVNLMSIQLNKAQAHKWKGDRDKMNEIINNLDLSGASDEFKLAELILRDKFDEAAKLVERIGSDSDYISEKAYRVWPIFKEFRKSPEFLAAFEVTFCKEFELVTTEEITISNPDADDKDLGDRN
jgi:hypothetical protein